MEIWKPGCVVVPYNRRYGKIEMSRNGLVGSFYEVSDQML